MGLQVINMHGCPNRARTNHRSKTTLIADFNSVAHTCHLVAMASPRQLMFTSHPKPETRHDKGRWGGGGESEGVQREKRAAGKFCVVRLKESWCLDALCFEVFRDHLESLCELLFHSWFSLRIPYLRTLVTAALKVPGQLQENHFASSGVNLPASIFS